MNLFVTGATGFIGSHFLNTCHANGHSVSALRRMPQSHPRVPLDFEPQWVDRSLDQINAEDLAGIDCLVHLAAHTPNVPYDSIEACLHWNVTVPLAMFRHAWQAGIQRFVIAGSCFEYGAAGERYEFIPTDAPLEATLSYPMSKAVASRVFSGFAAEVGARLSIHRIFQVYGPGESERRLWPMIRKAAQAGEDFEATLGEQVRDFIHVEQVAKHLLLACELSDVQVGEPYIDHVGTGHPQTIRQFVEHWWDAWNATGQLHFGKIPYRDHEVMRYVPETGSLTAALGTIS